MSPLQTFISSCFSTKPLWSVTHFLSFLILLYKAKDGKLIMCSCKFQCFHFLNASILSQKNFNCLGKVIELTWQTEWVTFIFQNKMKISLVTSYLFMTKRVNNTFWFFYVISKISKLDKLLAIKLYDIYYKISNSFYLTCIITKHVDI